MAASKGLSAKPQTKAQPKYHEIIASLRQGLAAGLYRNGARLPSEAELARRFKVSRMTVVKAFQQLQHDGLVIRRVGSGTYAAEAPQSGGLVFGLLIPDLGLTEIFEPICRGMARSPEAKRHSLLWGPSFAAADNRSGQAIELCAHYLAQKVNGVFFAPLEFSPDREAVNRQILQSLRQAHVPVVLLDRCGLQFPRTPEFDLIGLDNRRAGFLLTQHLLVAGARHVAFLAREGSVETVEARMAGCREALHAHGKTLLDTMVMAGDAVDEQAMAWRIRKGGIDAVICGNDQTAAKLMKALLNAGIQIPEQVRVAGFDDVSYGSLLQVPLTTIHQPCGDIGASAMAAMLARVKYPEAPPRSILLYGRLVVRRSCGASAAHSPQAGTPALP